MRKHLFVLKLVLMLCAFVILSGCTVCAEGPNADKEGEYRLNLWYDYYSYDKTGEVNISHSGGFQNKPTTPFIVQYGSEKIVLEPEKDSRSIYQDGERVYVTTYEFRDIVTLDEQWPQGKEIKLLSIPTPEGYELCCPESPVLKFGNGNYTEPGQKEIQCRIPLKKVGEQAYLNKTSVSVFFMEKKKDPQFFYEYTGSPVIPTVEVYLNGQIKLTEGVDYTVSFQNNSFPTSSSKGEIMNAEVIVQGIGMWAGQKEADFQIFNAAESKGAGSQSGGASSGKRLPAKGSVVKSGSIRYQVTASKKKNGTVAVKGVSGGKKSVKIPDTVKINGYVFKVTRISDNAFRNNKKLKSVTIGKNVTSIGKNAFAGDRALKSIAIRSKKLKKVGSRALKGISRKAVIKVPSQKLSAYRKLLKNKGQGKKVKIRRSK